MNKIGVHSGLPPDFLGWRFGGANAILATL
jgi:hypothetical protein